MRNRGGILAVGLALSILTTGIGNGYRDRDGVIRIRAGVPYPYPDILCPQSSLFGAEALDVRHLHQDRVLEAESSRRADLMEMEARALRGQPDESLPEMLYALATESLKIIQKNGLSHRGTADFILGVLLSAAPPEFELFGNNLRLYLASHLELFLHSAAREDTSRIFKEVSNEGLSTFRLKKGSNPAFSENRLTLAWIGLFERVAARHPILPEAYLKWFDLHHIPVELQLAVPQVLRFELFAGLPFRPVVERNGNKLLLVLSQREKTVLKHHGVILEEYQKSGRPAFAINLITGKFRDHYKGSQWARTSSDLFQFIREIPDYLGTYFEGTGKSRLNRINFYQNYRMRMGGLASESS